MLKHHEVKCIFKKLFIQPCLLMISRLGITVSSFVWDVVETSLKATALLSCYQVGFCSVNTLLFISEAYAKMRLKGAANT